MPSLRFELDEPDRHVGGQAGWSSTTVNVAVPPASVVTSPEVGLTVIPAASLSLLLTDTSAGVQAVVDGVGAGRRARSRSCRPSSPSTTGVVHAGHRHRLRHVPVAAGERDARRRRPCPRSRSELRGRWSRWRSAGCRSTSGERARCRPPRWSPAPPSGSTVIPATSLSVLVTGTSAGFRPVVVGVGAGGRRRSPTE